MVDAGTEQTLYDDLVKQDDSKFAKDFAKLSWNERSQYARDLSARLDANRDSHPELPALTLDIRTFRDFLGQTQEFVASVKAVEERSWFNPLRYVGGTRTSPYEIYSPTLREKMDYYTNRAFHTL